MPSSKISNKNHRKRRVSNEKTQNIYSKKMKNLDIEEKDINEINLFVVIPQVEKNIKHFQLCIEKNLSILLSGPVSSGKSTFIDYMARLMNKTVCRVQLSDDTDCKNLLGGYCATDVPNEYRWVDGLLIRAMKSGYWLVLEDVLTGQSDIFGMLRSLFEAETHGLKPKISNIVQLNEEIIANEDFRIIATQSLSETEDGYREVSLKTESCRYSSNCLNKCQTILMDKLSQKSIEMIIKFNYPSITSFLSKLTCEQGIIELVMKFHEHKGLSRVNSARDLFKFCHRISNINQTTEEQSVCYFLDALDCFVHHLSDNEYKQKIITILGAILNLTKAKVENIMQHRSCKITSDPIRENILYVGRVDLRKKDKGAKDFINPSRHMAQTRQTIQLLETLSRCVQLQEPVLLVSETGCGKTSTVQYLSKLLYRKLTVINMNQESDSSDWLGGYKPINNVISDHEQKMLLDSFNELMTLFYETFKLSFNGEKNAVFLNYVKNAHESKNYEVLLKLIGSKVISDAVQVLEKTNLSSTLKADWRDIYAKVNLLTKELAKFQSSYSFNYIEGALVQAMRNGDWILLDEINLAPPEMLQSLSGLLESSKGSVTLVEKGDKTPVIRHDDFRIFACMNPCTDVGKKNLSQGLRNRFTEIYLHELNDLEELSIIVKYYLGSLSDRLVESIVRFYLELRMNVKKNLIVDGAENVPQFSLRTLCRALEAVGHIISSELYKTTTIRALYEGFSFSFKSQLKDKSRDLFDKLFRQHFKVDIKKLESVNLLSKAISAEQLMRKDYRIVVGYPIKTGSIYKSNIEDTDDFVKGYKITKSVSRNLKDLARIVSSGKSLPVLVQGETSVGKTSLITYLAKLTGNVCHRVNNHESTDVQEYIGSYFNESSNGSKRKFVFKEGILVHAMRKGHWIILDELNLAPTQVLEALNRVLDDNRELFIAETQTTIKAHPMFRLFATQNPPGMYGGRNVLSRALRNRFIELHFNPIPDVELVEILEESCKIPKTKGRKMVDAMRLLHTKTLELDFAQVDRKYISLRDLFRWAKRVYQEHNRSNRFFDWDRTMLEEGYLLLTGKERSIEGVKVVTETLLEIFKSSQVELNDQCFFSPNGSNIAKSILEKCSKIQGVENIEWTFELSRMAVLVIRALQCNEPVLLVGNTGCGKTTICQLAAIFRNSELLSINCHQHTDASDFLGAMRTVNNDNKKSDRLFEWVDGPLVVAMKEGKMFLIDEISLADHSVLERLNSVLESDRKLTLVENSPSHTESEQQISQSSFEIIASPEFQVVATMNPGGDNGKKELSPALRNRFTEIWCSSNSWITTESGFNDWIKIASRNLCNFDKSDLAQMKVGVAKVMVNFLRYVHDISYEIKFSVVTIRDLLAWIQFINISVANNVSIYESIIHGSYMVIIDSINTKVEKNIFEMELLEKIKELIRQHLPEFDIIKEPNLSNKKLTVRTPDLIGINPFYISKGPHSDPSMFAAFSNEVQPVQKYSFTNKTTIDNLYRLFRAMQISKKPLLLEGSPGVGKTSLVSQLAKISGFKVVRINLSEQTEASDLFGCVLPVDNDKGIEFSWRDGPFLQALRNGDWILLDEMNLASSEVLESLNACFDHRGEIYIPEINQTFHLKQSQTRFFACQNPQSEGSGRNSLPKSFINRFNQVYMASLERSDYVDILSNIYCQIPQRTICFMVDYVRQLQYEVMVLRSFGERGSPWEFNLRDLTRWCDLLITHQSKDNFEPSIFASLLFITRFRTYADQEEAANLYNKVADEYRFNKLYTKNQDIYITRDFVKIGRAKLKINNDIINRQNKIEDNSQFIERSLILPGQLAILESIMLTIEMGWLTILVGGSGTGKTNIVHLLAEITNNNLKSMSMNSSMDTCDLLGSYEQIQGGKQIKWIDSTLVKALKNGDWLVLDTVNFCKPSVLDRLNGLLETNGSLILNEKGTVNGGQLEEIKPHSNFRMFLVMDPDCGGEISRAMRNRGLEICMVASHKEKPLNDQDILSLLTTVHKISIEKARQLINFHKSVIGSQEIYPEIRIVNLSSLMQACRLINQGYTVEQCLEIVYKDIQLNFNIRDVINENINNIEHNQDDSFVNEIFFSAMSLSSSIKDPKTAMVQQHFTAVKNCLKTLSDDSHPLNENRLHVARVFMQCSSLNDIFERLSVVQYFDKEFHHICSGFGEILNRFQNSCNNSSLPIDVRWLPNWAEFISSDYQQANSVLFEMYNLVNAMDNDKSFDIDEKIKPSSLTENTIGQFNVFQIAKLLGLGRLSKAIIKRFFGFDKSIVEFIDILIKFKFADFCTMKNIFLLIHISKLFKRFCQILPSQNNNWISAFFFHITSILETLSMADVKCFEIMRLGQQILDKNDGIYLRPEENVEITRDIFKAIGVKRNLVRLAFPHSKLEECYNHFRSLVEEIPKEKLSVSIWKTSAEESLKDALCSVFFKNTDEKEDGCTTKSDLSNQFDIETVRIWPFMLILLAKVINSSSKPLIGLNEFGSFLPPLPCEFQNRLSVSEQNSVNFVTVSDWTAYLISQGPLNQIVANCYYQFDNETDQYSVELDLSTTSFTQPLIKNVWTDPNSAIFLLVSGSRSQKDILAYFTKINSVSSVNRCLRSISTRKLQLQICKQNYMESVCIVTSNKLRIEKERKLLIEMIELQKNCILNCFKGEGNVNEWMAANFPWFTCLELDINDLNKVIDDKNENQTTLEIGKLWIRWGCVQMKLFNLCEKLDPQSQLYWENKYLNEEIKDLLKLKNISSMYTRFLSGITKEDAESEECWSENGLGHPFLNATWKRLKDLTEIFHNQKSYDLRPVSDEKYIELKSRVMRFLSVYGWTSLCDDGESTMRKVSNFDSAFLTEWSVMSGELLDYFLSSTDRFVYPDLIEPLALGIGRVLVGLDLLHKSKMMGFEDDERTKCATKICEIFCQFPNCNTLDLVERILKEEQTIINYCSVLIGESKAEIMAKIHIRLLNLSLRLLNLPNNNRVRTVYLLHKLIRTFNVLWNKQEKKRLEKEEAEASCYLKKQSITSTLSEEELETLNIYLEVCPLVNNENGNQYFDEKSMEMSSTMNLAISKIQKLREHLETLERGMVLSEETVHSIVMLIDNILNDKSSLLSPEEEIETKQESRKIFQDCYQFAATVICSNSKNVVDSEKMCLFPMHISALMWEYDNLSTAVSVKTNEMSFVKPYDIYQDPVRICNIITAQSILEESQKSVKKYLNEYPENVTLLRIDKNINTILNLSLDNSLITFKTSVERLLHEIQQWEIVAARHVSLISHVEKLNKLLSLWSHEELKMWENTLVTASWKLKRSVSTEFFKIYNSLLNETEKIEKQCENCEEYDFQSSVNTILEPIMFSVTNSNIGNFKSILVIIKLIIDYINSISEWQKSERVENNKIGKDRFLEKLKFVLKNHLNYYELYQSNVDYHLSIEHKKIETELKNFIKAKKWGDAPPKSTDLAKCHKIVFKYLRQWNDVINKPVNTFMTLNPINALKNVVLHKSQDCSLLSLWSEEMLQFCRDMWDAMNRLKKETTDLEVKASEHVKNSSMDEKDLESLKKAWFANVKNLQQRKRNFVTTFVKQLKDEIGLNLFYTRFPRHTALMTHLPLGDVELNISAKKEKKGVASTDIEKLSAIRCISLRLQLDESDKSEEFAKFNMLKDHLIGTCDHLLSITCNNSIRINRWKIESENLHMMIKNLARTLKFECRFQIDPRYIEQELESMNFDYMQKLGEWLTFIDLCSESIIEISNSKTLPFIINDDHLKPKLLLSSSSTFSACRMINECINNIIEEIQKNKVPQCFVVTQEHLDCLNRQKSIMKLIEILTENIKRQFSPEWIEINSTITLAFEELNRKNLEVIEKLEFSLYKQSTLTIMDRAQHQSLTFKELKELIDHVNERITKLNEAQLHDKVDNGENIDLSIIKIVGVLDKMEANIEISTIREKLNQIIEGLKWISDPSSFDEMRKEINQSLLPNLSGMMTVIDEFSFSLINIHNVLLGATDSLITVTSKLMSEGFCKPNESIWEKNEDDGESSKNEKMNDFEMAGMDVGGTGMNDVSDQIESESQIEGTNKDKNNDDNKDNDVEDEENGIEMTEDFDAKFSDNKEENEKKNEDDNEKDDEMKDLEDKMGEVGESPETDVNKESWDKENHEEEAEENKDEEKTKKNEDKRKGGVSSKEDIEMVANDEEKEEQKPEDASDEGAELSKEVANEWGEKEDEMGDSNFENDNKDSEKDAIDDFWDDDGCLDENEEKKDLQNEELNSKIEEDEPNDNENNEEDGDDIDLEDNKTKDEVRKDDDETMDNDFTVQEQNIVGRDGSSADIEMNYDIKLDEENEALGDNKNDGDTGNGNGYDNSMNQESANGGEIEQNLGSETPNPQTIDKENEDKMSKPLENRTLGNANENFKRKADVVDIKDKNECKRPRLTGVYGHIDENENKNEENEQEGVEQVLDDATANQEQQIPEMDDKNYEDETSNEAKVREEAEKNDDSNNEEMDKYLEIDKKMAPKNKTPCQNEEDKESDVLVDVKQKSKEILTWSKVNDGKTQSMIGQLCEDLRTVLQPTKASMYGGSYSSGKKINMKKLVQILASGDDSKNNFWMRRIRPRQREYQVLISADNSLSMSYNVSNQVFFKSLAVVLGGLTMLKVGQVGVCKFGDKAEVVVPLHEQFNSEIGEELIRKFDFTDRCSKFVPMLELSLQLFDENRYRNSSSTSQFLIILSDGNLSEDVSDPKLVGLIRQARNKGIMVFVLILDHPDPKESIQNLKMVVDEGNDFVRFLDHFPFQHFNVLKDVINLPTILSNAIRRWFALSSGVDRSCSR